jgi:hypothetical protein
MVETGIFGDYMHYEQGRQMVKTLAHTASGALVLGTGSYLISHLAGASPEASTIIALADAYIGALLGAAQATPY